MALIIHIDGGARGNPGPAGAGVVISTDDGRLIHEGGYFLGRQTNNQAEYTGLIRALDRAARCGDQPLTIYSDSELLVKQITGEYRVKNAGLQELYYEVQKRLIRVSVWKIKHVRREQNTRADELANLAMDHAADQIVFDADRPGGTPGAATSPNETSTPADSTRRSDPARPAAHQGRPTPNHDDPAPGAAARSAWSAKRPAPPDLFAGAGRAVRIRCAIAPADGACPAGGVPVELTIGQTLPGELCVYAAHAMLHTILAMQGVEPSDFPKLPTMTVRCGRPGCGAIFHLSPQHTGNGQANP